jgi:hypothetical protein
MKKAITYIMLALLLALLLLPLISCKKDVLPDPSPSDASRIEGRWVDMTGTLYPDWHYHFEAGLLTQSYIKAGATITALTYPYAIRQDTVFIGGDATNAPRVWLLHFECHEITEVVQSAPAFSQRFWLRREP